MNRAELDPSSNETRAKLAKNAKNFGWMKTELPHRSLIAPWRFIRNLDLAFWSLFTRCSWQTRSYSAVLRSKGRNQSQSTFEGGDLTRAFGRILLWEVRFLVELKSVETLARP